ncbi:MAG: hypothetical protein EPN82_13190 [Bacteroidetes bacterium]|nr:MAG: hypothetical protein EPN82_13190 [Bacteroidota bacterium]
MKIIVDTNIVFSAILNTEGKIGNLLIDSEKQFQFFSTDYLRFELNKHHQKLKYFSGLSDFEIEEAKYRITKYIQFINIEIIPEQIWKEAGKIISDIDIDDIDFVALTISLGGYLWTGDKELNLGLKSKGFTKVITTNELWERREKFLIK